MLKRINERMSEKIHSLKQRMILIMVFGIMIWCMVISVIVTFYFQTVEKNRVKNGMYADVGHMTEMLDEKYYFLVKLSQQMTVNGNVGSLFSSYLQAEEPYDKIEYSNNVTSMINTMIFNYKSGALASYFLIDEKEVVPVFPSFPIKENPFEEKFPIIGSSSEIEFHTCHEGLNAFSDKQVISLIRKEDFGTGNYVIYAECPSELKEQLMRIASSRNVEYSLLMLNEEGRICDSTIPEFFLGDMFEVNESFGKKGQFYYVSQKSDFGFRNVLLINQNDYIRWEYEWKINILLIFCIGIISIILLVVLFSYFIYWPIRQLEKDMEEAGNGNLAPVERKIRIDEFDRLFDRFNEMKNKVSRLMEDIRRSEFEKQQLEIDKLYYQINPHFLMNALNSLHWIAVANNQKEIETYIYQLNFILGYSLGKIYKKATFGTELKSLELYLELQKKRHDFNVWKDIHMNQWMDYPCARLILQPLAENAICHNMDSFGNLWITMTCNGRNVRILIRDDGKGIHFLNGEEVSAKRLNTGIGLRYVQMSLYSFYGERASIQIESEENKGTTVIVEISL